MGQEFRIRLGGVEAVYDVRLGLILHDAQDARTELTIYESDLPDLIQFVLRHSPATGDVIRLAEPHWQRSGTKHDQQDARSVSDDQ